MMEKLMIGAALGALTVSGALAQSPSPSLTSNPSPPAAAQTQTDRSGGKADFVSSQKPDQWVATKFKGTEVLGSDNQSIGSISDILFDKSGKIDAFVVSVGGFLGMGAKEVALSPSAFDTVPGDNGGAQKLKISMNKDDLTHAQNFARYEPPRPATTTGSGLSGLPGGKMHPSSNTPPTGR